MLENGGGLRAGAPKKNGGFIGTRHLALFRSVDQVMAMGLPGEPVAPTIGNGAKT